MTEHLTEPITVARKYLPKELNKELSDLFDEFVTNPNNVQNERDLKEVLYQMSINYPVFVYDPFNRLYEQLKYSPPQV